MTLSFVPTRAAGLSELADFVPHAGRDYAAGRNYDHGPGGHSNVSGMSPYIRHRLVTEAEVVKATLAVHSPTAAEKFVQEVFWRTYWKGWLELRPEAWRRYRTDVARQLPDASDAYLDAIAGRTGIDCFDAWAQELVENGYLHNHTRMWFASIWIFTLRLPWQLGADFFLRHLYDGDPASNTLSWRWVAGLQTAGKTYLATADNIARYTEGRFSPAGLATSAVALTEEPLPSPAPLDDARSVPTGRVGLLLHDDDLNPESLFSEISEATRVGAVAGFRAVTGRSPASVSQSVIDFTHEAMTDALARAADHLDVPGTALDELSVSAVLDWAAGADVATIITPYAPIGPAQEQLARLGSELADSGIALVPVRRRWDSLAWPHARRGYFGFRENIPQFIRQQGLGR